MVRILKEAGFNALRMAHNPAAAMLPPSGGWKKHPDCREAGEPPRRAG